MERHGVVSSVHVVTDAGMYHTRMVQYTPYSYGSIHSSPIVHPPGGPVNYEAMFYPKS